MKLLFRSRLRHRRKELAATNARALGVRAERYSGGWPLRCPSREQSITASQAQITEGLGSSPVEDPSYGRSGERRRSASLGDVCLGGMYVTYLAITILAALANGYAASLDFVGAASVKLVADRVQVSRRWMVPLGVLLASGAVGLLAGFAVPALGTAAAIGLVLYFICAVTAHLRVRDPQIGGAVFFLLLAAAALTTDFAYHNHR
jgi:hypothetical protein